MRGGAACRHTTRFITLYTCFMPLLLWGQFKWWTFAVASLITMLLAGIDNIGIMIEVRCDRQHPKASAPVIPVVPAPPSCSSARDNRCLAESDAHPAHGSLLHDCAPECAAVRRGVGLVCPAGVPA